MTASWKTVRVFISSTFRDMHAERDHLVKVVFPALRESLSKDRIYLDDIDLRWGVTKEQAENDQVLDLCLRQIDQCRPFFVGILGERYGWVPRDFPADAQTNFGWIQHHTGKSLTELEMVHGVLNDSGMRSRAFFYLRDSAFIAALDDEQRRVFLECPTEDELGELSPEAAAARAQERRQKLDVLKNRILALREKLFVYENYPCQWDPAQRDPTTKQPGRLVGLKAFGDSVCQQLGHAIRSEPELQSHLAAAARPTSDLHGLKEEADLHRRFMESRLRVYVGRAQINRELFAYALGSKPVTCLVTGPSGTGKSAALARFVTDFEQRYPAAIVVPHFVGASPRSTSLRDMLRRFCHILKDRFGFSEGVPEESAKLVVRFRDFLARTAERPQPQGGPGPRILLVIDALNQLDEQDQAHRLEWLPATLPPGTKVIASCIMGSGRAEPVIEVFRRRPCHHLQIAPLNVDERRQIIEQVPSLSAKALDARQIEQLLDNPATVNPLFLLVALEELRGFGSYERLNERIAAFPRSGDTVTAIFDQVLQRLESDFQAELVRAVVSLIACARRGLSEAELRALLADHPARDDLFPVLRQLRPYLLSRDGLFDFYHRNLHKAVVRRCLNSSKDRQAAHAQLAEFFHAQDYWQETVDEQRDRALRIPPTSRPANIRKVDELPWQRLHARQGAEIVKLWSELPFLEAKAEAGLAHELVTDFAEAIHSLPPDHAAVRRMRLLHKALRRDLNFIAEHPTALFQSVWNLCWWYDTPQAAAHYEPPPNPSDRGRAPWERAGPKLSALLESWWKLKQSMTPGFRWVRSVRPPALYLGAPLIAVLREEDGTAECVAYSTDGKLLASGNSQKEVLIWDVASGTVVRRLRGHQSTVRCVAFSPNGTRVASGAGAGDESIRIWNAETGDCLRTLRLSSVDEVRFSADGNHLVLRRRTGVDVHDLSTGNTKAGNAVGQRRNVAECVAMTGDGSLAVSALVVWPGSNPPPAGNYTVSVCDVFKDSIRTTFRGFLTGRPVAISPDGRLIAIGSKNGELVLREAATGKGVPLVGGSGDVVHVTFSADGQRLVSAARDRAIRLWDVATGRELRCIYCDGDVYHPAVSPDGRFVATADGMRGVRIWDLKSNDIDAPSHLRGNADIHSHGRAQIQNPMSLAVTVRGVCVVTSSSDETSRTWDGATGVPLGSHAATVFSVSSYPEEHGLPAKCQDHVAVAQELAIGPDGKSISPYSYDGRVVEYRHIPVAWFHVLGFFAYGNTFGRGRRWAGLDHHTSTVPMILALEGADPVVLPQSASRRRLSADS